MTDFPYVLQIITFSIDDRIIRLQSNQIYLDLPSVPILSIKSDNPYLKFARSAISSAYKWLLIFDPQIKIQMSMELVQI